MSFKTSPTIDNGRELWAWALGLGLALCVAASAYGEDRSIGHRRVTREELVAAMELQAGLGYDITAVTQGGRFFGSVVLDLVQSFRRADDSGTPLFVDHRDNFAAYLEVSGLTRETVPAFVGLAFEFRQDQTIEHRWDRVIESVESDEKPTLAVRVRSAWPKASDLTDSFSYADTHSTPNLRVTNQREISYKLLELGDSVVYDEVSGISGRATTGLLSVLFDLIGDGRVVRSRFAVSNDGLLIVVGHGKKGFIRISSTVTVRPDGIAKRGLPKSRPDLAALESKLEEPVKIRYR